MRSYLRCHLIAILFVIPFATTSVWATPLSCDEILSTYIEAAKCVNSSITRGACGDNIHLLVDEVAKRTDKGALDSATFHIIYRKGGASLFPQKVVDTVPWLYHVVLETQDGIWDFDSIKFLASDFKPVAKREYFNDVFGPHHPNFEGIMLISIPASKAIENNWKIKEERKRYRLVIEPSTANYREAWRAKEQVGSNFYMVLFTHAEEYYILSAEGQALYPPIPLADYLRSK